MGREDDTRRRLGRKVHEGVVERHRLGRERIEPRGRDASRLERRSKRFLIHNVAARCVDKHTIGAHLRKERPIDHAARLIGHGNVQAYDIAGGKQVIEACEANAQLVLEALVERMTLVVEHLATPGTKVARSRLADRAEAHKPDRAIPQLAKALHHHALLKSDLTTLANRPVAFERAPQAHEHEHDSLLGDGPRVHARAIAHSNAPSPRRVHIDRVEGNPLGMDELEIRHSFDKPHINRAYGVGDNDIGIGRSSKQIVVRGAPFGAYELGVARNRQVRQILARARLTPNSQNQHVNPRSTITATRYSKPIHCQYGTQTTSPARQVAR